MSVWKAKGYSRALPMGGCAEGVATMNGGLSEREQAVLNWLKHGLSNKEISLALGISPRTVQKHLQSVYRHLGVQTRAEAIVRMYRLARRARA